MNKTLKYEYGLKETLPDLKTAQKMTKQAVNLYNNHRLHFSLNFQTPAKVHLKENVKYKSYKRKKILNLTQQNNWKMCQLFQDNTKTIV